MLSGFRRVYSRVQTAGRHVGRPDGKLLQWKQGVIVAWVIGWMLKGLSQQLFKYPGKIKVFCLFIDTPQRVINIYINPTIFFFCFLFSYLFIKPAFLHTSSPYYSGDCWQRMRRFGNLKYLIWDFLFPNSKCNIFLL